VKQCLAPMIGLLAVLTPAMACAQTNLDQGKSAGQIFSFDCAECHKDAHALGKGKNPAALTDFLGEHYTTSRAQAAALAAFILGVRTTESHGTPMQAHREQPTEENVMAEQPKPSKRQARQAGKPEQEGKPANANLRRPAGKGANPKREASRGERGTPTSSAKPEGKPHEHGPANAIRNRREEPQTPPQPQEPPAVAHAVPSIIAEPAPAEVPSREPTPPSEDATPGSAPTEAAPASPANSASGESGEEAPVPRDNIPD
jgi:hypothetical protein